MRPPKSKILMCCVRASLVNQKKQHNIWYCFQENGSALSGEIKLQTVSIIMSHAVLMSLKIRRYFDDGQIIEAVLRSVRIIHWAVRVPTP